MSLKLDPAMLQGAIPGMSLTKEPGSMPWENPPELSTIDEVINFYLEKLLHPETEDLLLLVLDEGMSIERVAEFLSTSGTMNGRHSLDLAFLVDPFIRELIRYIAETANVSYIESYSERQKKGALPYRQVRKVIKEVFEEMPQTVTEAPTKIPTGLMAKLPKEEE